MKKVINLLLGTYQYPFFFLLAGLYILFSNPEKRLSIYIPFRLGEYQLLAGVICILFSLILGYVIYKYEKNKKVK